MGVPDGLPEGPAGGRTPGCSLGIGGRGEEDEQEHSEVGRYRIGSVSDLTGDSPPHTAAGLGAALRGRRSPYAPTPASGCIRKTTWVGSSPHQATGGPLGHAIGSIANLGDEGAPRSGWPGPRGAGLAIRRPPTRPTSSDAPQPHHALPIPLLPPGALRLGPIPGGGRRLLRGSTSVPLPRRWRSWWPGPPGAGGHRLPSPFFLGGGGTPETGLHPERPWSGSSWRNPDVAALVVVYDFAPRKVIRQLTLTGASLVQGAPGIDSLRRGPIRDALRTPDLPQGVHPVPLPERQRVAFPWSPTPPRLFTDADLVAGSGRVETAVDCECTQPHGADPVGAGGLRESTPRDCENRDAPGCRPIVCMPHASHRGDPARARAHHWSGPSCTCWPRKERIRTLVIQAQCDNSSQRNPGNELSRRRPNGPGPHPPWRRWEPPAPTLPLPDPSGADLHAGGEELPSRDPHGGPPWWSSSATSSPLCKHRPPGAVDTAGGRDLRRGSQARWRGVGSSGHQHPTECLERVYRRTPLNSSRRWRPAERRLA